MKPFSGSNKTNPIKPNFKPGALSARATNTVTNTRPATNTATVTNTKKITKTTIQFRGLTQLL